MIKAYSFMKGVRGHQCHDYFIVADGDKKCLAGLGFHWEKKFNLAMRTMTDKEVYLFKLLTEEYKLVLVCDTGRVYEQKDRSFKLLHDVQKEAVHPVGA